MDLDLHTLIINHQNEDLFSILNELVTQLDSTSLYRILNKKNSNKHTLIHSAIFSRNTAVIEKLIKSGADPSIKCFGTPCLHLVACSVILPDQNPDIWRDSFISLLESNEVNSRDDQGSTILHLLAEYDLVEFINILNQKLSVEMFLSLLESRDRLGYRPIHRAAIGDSAKSVDFFVKQSVKLSSQSLADETAWHIAASKKSADVWSALSSSGSTCTSTTDRYGRTAGDICTLNDWNPTKPPIATTTNLTIENQQRTAIISHKSCLKHSTCAPSLLEVSLQQAPPENSKRLSVLIDENEGVLRSQDLRNNLLWLDAKPAAISDVLRVHDWSYIKRVQQSCSQTSADDESTSGIDHLDGDTAISNQSFIAALHACGAVCDGVDLVVKKKVRNAFCPIRPPGHHAGPKGVVKTDNGPDSHGFCLVNNASVAAGYALHVHRETIKRVVIVDFDVHHGNGTEETVRYLRPRVESSDLLNPLCFGTLHTPVYKPWYDQSDSSNVLFVSVHGFGARERGLEFMLPKSAFYPGSGKTVLPEYDTLQKSSDNKNHQLATSSSSSATNKMVTEDGPGADDEDSDDDDDESYNDHDDYDALATSSTTLSPVASLKAIYESDAILNPSSSSTSKAMIPPLILDIGMELPPENEIDDGGLSYRYQWRNKWREEIFPRLLRFQPDIIIISAGFDGHRKDLINSGYLALVEEDFAWVTERLIQIANTCCDGRIVSALEGGYQLGGEFCSSFAKSVKAHVTALINGSQNSQKYNPEFEAIDKEFEARFVKETINRRIVKLQSQDTKSADATTEVAVSTDVTSVQVEQQPDATTVSTSKRKRPEVNYAELEKELNQNKQI